MSKLVSTARVTVTVDVFVSDGWAPTCTAQQIHEQAALEGVKMLERHLNSGTFQVVGKPKVTIITHAKVD